MTTVFLDMDGVLADFDKGACEILGTDNHYKYEFVHGPEVLWDRINSKPDFFLSLDPLPDADLLLEALQGIRTVVLTALPKTNTESVRAQKERWVREWISDEIPVITCFTKDKPNYCTPGSVLVDDRAINKKAWERAGGHYVIHTDALSSIRQLKELGVLS
jgi:hypothetical protein